MSSKKGGAAKGRYGQGKLEKRRRWNARRGQSQKKALARSPLVEKLPKKKNVKSKKPLELEKRRRALSYRERSER